MQQRSCPSSVWGRAATSVLSGRGAKAQVDKVKAVGQLEFKFSKIARIKGLIPIDNIKKKLNGKRRVGGGGFSAMICIFISRKGKKKAAQT